MTKKSEPLPPATLSRRNFARGLSITAAVAAVLPRDLLAQIEAPAPSPPKLSAASQAEAEAKIQNILRKYGSRLSDAEKADVRKSVLSQQESIDKLRAFPLENWDEPALVLRAVLDTK